VRHTSFETAEFIELLRMHEIGLVVADTAGKWPFIEDVTSDFVYVRLHGDEELYVSGYTGGALEKWEQKFRAWSTGGTPPGARLVGKRTSAEPSSREIFVYFDNDVKVHAPFDAMTLAHRLGLGASPNQNPDHATISETARRGWPAITRKSRKVKV
jgi:uncharacterized protein YecE (DUF72 family)